MEERKIDILPITSDGYNIKVGDIMLEVSRTAMSCFGITTIDEFNISGFVDYILDNAQNCLSIKRDIDFKIKKISLLSDRILCVINIDNESETRLFSGGEDVWKKFVLNNSI